MNNRVHQGHLARKRFGQNFLNDQFVIDSIVSAINPQKGQAMVEIGPSLAALTEPVGERLDQLTVIELDRDLAARLQTHPFLGPKLTIYQQDAMTMNFGELAEKMGQPLRVFGNLPYNISTPLMFHLFSYTDAIADMHFMLQKEVVNRLVAGPNSKAYGRLSVMAQYYCQTPAVQGFSGKYRNSKCRRARLPRRLRSTPRWYAWCRTAPCRIRSKRSGC